MPHGGVNKYSRRSPLPPRAGGVQSILHSETPWNKPIYYTSKPDRCRCALVLLLLLLLLKALLSLVTKSLFSLRKWCVYAAANINCAQYQHQWNLTQCRPAVLISILVSADSRIRSVRYADHYCTQKHPEINPSIWHETQTVAAVRHDKDLLRLSLVFDVFFQSWTRDARRASAVLLS